jgi:hypothetical protein
MAVACHPVPETVGGRRVVVIGVDADAVGRDVARRRERGERAAGFVGADEALARAMGEEMLGGVEEVVRAEERRS